MLLDTTRSRYVQPTDMARTIAIPARTQFRLSQGTSSLARNTAAGESTMSQNTSRASDPVVASHTRVRSVFGCKFSELPQRQEHPEKQARDDQDEREHSQSHAAGCIVRGGLHPS